MSNNILNEELSQIKYLFVYKPGRVISEQQTPTNKVLYSDNFGNEFESGMYSFNPQYSSVVNEKIAKISDYIKDKNLKDFKIVINSGESQVPNQPPFDKEKGSLAKKRAEVLKAYLEKTLIPVLLPVKPNIEITSPVIGQTPWDPKKGKDNEDYKEEQYVNASLELSTEVPPQETPKLGPQKTQFMISWTLDNRCDRIKYFNTFADMDAVKKQFESNPRFTAAYYEIKGVPPTSAVLKLGYLENDPPTNFFVGPFFDSCTQKFETAKQ